MNDLLTATLFTDIRAIKADIELLGNAFSKMSEALNEQTKLVEHHDHLLRTTLRRPQSCTETRSERGNTFVTAELEKWLERHDMKAITKADWMRWQADQEELKRLRATVGKIEQWAKGAVER